MKPTLDFFSFKKLVIFGSEGVGKTNLINRMESNTFISEQEPTKNPIEPRKIVFKTNSEHELALNILEVKIDSKDINERSIGLLEDILFECQCCLFMIDITSTSSFESVKNILSRINSEHFPYMKKILIFNKSDLENDREVSGFEATQYINEKKDLDYIDLSLLNPNNLQTLYEKIYKYLYLNDNKLPGNIISLCKIQRKDQLINIETQGQLRIILIGDTEVGKTSFVSRFFNDEFKDSIFATIGINDEFSLVKIQTELYKLTVWDTAGQERFRALPKKYYQNSDGVLLLFDVTKPKTFENVQRWMKDICDNTYLSQDNSKVIIFLIGNKIDMVDERQIEKSRAEYEAKNLGMEYYEVSCKAGLNLFEVMNNMILKCYMKYAGVKDAFSLKKTDKNKNQKSGGCCGGSKEYD